MLNGTERLAHVSLGVACTTGIAPGDLSGREFLDLKPGANDVRSLAPGVYFVRAAQAQAMRKVVVTR